MHTHAHTQSTRLASHRIRIAVVALGLLNKHITNTRTVTQTHTHSCTHAYTSHSPSVSVGKKQSYAVLASPILMRRPKAGNTFYISEPTSICMRACVCVCVRVSVCASVHVRAHFSAFLYNFHFVAPACAKIFILVVLSPFFLMPHAARPCRAAPRPPAGSINFDCGPQQQQWLWQ